MKEFFKSLKPGLLLTGIFSLVLGVILLVFPDVVEGALRWVLGGGLALFGLLEVVSVFVRPNGIQSVGRMIPGILCVAVGIVFLFRFETFVSLLWTLIGIAVLIDAVYKIQYAFELKAAKAKNWWVNLLFSLAALIFAAVLMMEPIKTGEGMIILTGIFLLVNGIFDVVCLSYMSHQTRHGIVPVATVEIQDAPAKEETNVVKK